MPIWNQLKAGAYAAADLAIKTGSDLYSKGKEQGARMVLENRLAKTQRQLGALVYSMHKTGEENSELVGRYIKAIAEVEQQLESIGAHSAAVSNAENTTVISTTFCPQCGAEVDPGAVFCNGCGNKLA